MRSHLMAAKFSMALMAGLGMVLAGAPVNAQEAAPNPAEAAPEDAEKGVETKKFDDWVVACATPKDSPKKLCQAVQTLSNKENGKRVMQIMVGYPDEGAEPIAIFVLPLGYLLQAGSKFELDGKEIRVLAAERCIQTGCIVPLPLDKEMLAKFKGGTAGRIEVTIAKDRTMDLPVSLKGFSAALAELRKS